MTARQTSEQQSLADAYLKALSLAEVEAHWLDERIYNFGLDADRATSVSGTPAKSAATDAPASSASPDASSFRTGRRARQPAAGRGRRTVRLDRRRRARRVPGKMSGQSWARVLPFRPTPRTAACVDD
jgi:hypothetical protein